MGGKGGGGRDYYQEPPDKSGYGTLSEAEQTLKNTQPINMEGYQQNINVKKAAADATAKKPTLPAEQTPVAEGESGTTTTEEGAGETAKKAVLTPPTFWEGYGQGPASLFKNNTDSTTNTTQI